MKARRVYANFLRQVASSSHSNCFSEEESSAESQTTMRERRKIIANLQPIIGRDRVIRFFAGLSRKPSARQILPRVFTRLNGLPAIVNREPGGSLQATLLMIENGKITAIYRLRNPDKTQHLEHLMVE